LTPVPSKKTICAIQPVETLKLTAENNDLLPQFVFKGIDASKPASVELHFDGSGTLAYQVAGRYFTPWEDKPATEALSIGVAYDRTLLARTTSPPPPRPSATICRRPPSW
jgi:hypothetical protein